MSRHDNILTIYDRLSQVSDNMDEDHFKTGFNQCLYLLSHALKNLDSINTAIEIKRLKHELYIAKLKIDEDGEVIYKLKQDKKETHQKLLRVNAHNKNLLNTTAVREAALIKASTGEGELREINIEYQGHILKFYSNCTQESFDKHFPIGLEIMMDRKKKKSWPPDTAKAWFMDYYRKLGFICSTFK